MPENFFRQIAAIHAEQLKAGFLPLLGQEILERIYRHASCNSDALLLAVVDGDTVLGFVMGAISTRDFYLTFALRNFIPLVWRLMTRPTLLLRTLSATKYAASSTRGQATAELLSIAVKQGVDRKGVGSSLLCAFQQQLRERKITSFHVLAADTQKPALAFYRKHAGVVVNETTLGGLHSYRFRINT